MSQNSKTDEFGKYLEGKSTLSQLYAELPEVDVPRHLDAAILAEAHRAVGSRPGAKSGRRWTIPLGMVATLFLVVMIGLHLPSMLQDAAAPQQYKEEKDSAMTDKGRAEGAIPTPDERSKIQGSELAKSDITRREPVPMAAEAEVTSGQNKPVFIPPNESPAARLELSTAQAKPKARMSLAPVEPVISPQAPAIAARHMEMSESADAASGMAPAKEKKASRPAAANLSDAFEQRAPAAAMMAAPQPAPLERSLKDESSEVILTPDDWLIHIKKLKHEGKLEEVKKELAAFKKRYPDYHVPEALEVR